MYLAVLIVHIVVCLVMTGLILLQHGKGADAGVAFGGSGSAGQTQNLGMTKIIGLIAVIFFATSLALGFLSSHNQGNLRLAAHESHEQSSDTAQE